MQMKSLYLTVQRVIPVTFRKFLVLENKVAVCDPVYPVYVDTNVMAGRTGDYNTEKREL